MLFFFNDTATTEIYTLSLHDALPNWYVYPAVETIAKIRHTSARTIQRHIRELIKAKLLTRIRQRNKPSILYIEDVSDAEVNKYFQFFEAKETKGNFSQAEIVPQSRNDKTVVSHKAPETTKMSLAYD